MAESSIFRKTWFLGIFLFLGISLFQGALVFSETDPHHESMAIDSSQEAHATEEGKDAGHHDAQPIPSWNELMLPLAFRFLNVIAFFTFLFFILRKPISKYLVTRKDTVEEAIHGSAERKDRAQKQFEEYNRRLEMIEQEIEHLKESLRQEGQMESQKIMQRSERLAKSIRKDANLIAEADLEELKDELRREVIETAALVAKDTIRTRLKDEDRNRLTQDFVKSLEETKSKNNGKSGHFSKSGEKR